jgi:hypothetical protein
MECPETHFGGLGSAMGYTPAAIGVLAESQVLQMVLNVFA